MLNNNEFDWKLIGDINLGRPNLGSKTSVAIYRLMQYSIRHVLNAQIGKENTDKIMFDAGKVGGYAVFKTF